MPAFSKIRWFVVCALLAVTGAGLASSAFAASGPPVFLLVPDDRVAYEGERVTFQVASDGTSPIVFQWFQNDQPIAGANGPSFVLAQVGLADDGAVFSVSASNALGQVISSNAVLTVKPGIVVTASPNDGAQVIVPQ